MNPHLKSALSGLSKRPRIPHMVISAGVALGIATAFLLASNSVTATPDQTSLPPTMGGYQEDHSFHFPGQNAADLAADDRARYLKEKKELQSAIEACTARSATCFPRVKAFASIIETARHAPNKLAQIHIIDAGINIAIAYDYAEAANAKSNADHRSLLKAIKDEKGVCDERARLKLFAFEALSYNPNDIRFVVEDIYRQGTKGGGHAVLLLRLTGKSWILNDQSAVISKTPPTNMLTLYDTTIESDVAQLNFSQKSNFARNDKYFVPKYEFNAYQSAAYISHEPRCDLRDVPIQARTAKMVRNVFGRTPAEARLLNKTMQLADIDRYTKPSIVAAHITAASATKPVIVARCAAMHPAPQA